MFSTTYVSQLYTPRRVPMCSNQGTLINKLSEKMTLLEEILCDIDVTAEKIESTVKATITEAIAKGERVLQINIQFYCFVNKIYCLLTIYIHLQFTVTGFINAKGTGSS